MSDTLTFFHAPQTRSAGVAVLLDELGAPYTLHVLNMKAGEQREAAYLAVNPMGKVPAIRHGDAVVTEQVAIYTYLADLFPSAGLTPAIADPLRGPYLRWLAYYGSCFEPAMIDKALKRDAPPPGMSPYGSYDDVLRTLTTQLQAGPFITGERMTAADVLWGLSLRWITKFGLVPELPEIMAYVDRIGSRPTVAKVEARDAELAAEHAAVVAKASGAR